MHLPAALRRRIFYTALAMIISGGSIYAVRPLPAPKSPQVGDSLVQPSEDKVVDKKEALRSEPPAAASLPPQKTVVEPRPKVQTYKVAGGDTVGGIAEKFGLKQNTVLWANDLDEDELLSIGQELIIPTVDGLVRKVRSGDTLWDIAADYSADVDAIVQANPDLEPGVLQPGQVLLVPGGQPPSRRQVASARGSGRSGAIRSFDYWPAQGPLTDPFGWRTHPVYGTRHFHDGMDIGVGAGTPLRAVSAGTVVMASRYGGYGLAVRIDHGGGVTTQYSHMSQIDVQPGQKVAAGEHIGYSGSTGVSTGPHLHFSVFLNGAPTDPEPWMP